MSIQHIAETIYRRRSVLHMSQLQLAEAMGTGQRVVSYWETGSNIPRTRDLVRLCRVLKITPNELLGWDEEGAAP